MKELCYKKHASRDKAQTSLETLASKKSSNHGG